MFLKVVKIVIKNQPISLRDLFKLGMTCKKIRKIVQLSVKDLQICVEDGSITQSFDYENFNHHLVLNSSPERFFYPNPPFKWLRKLFLNFNGEFIGKINLTGLPNLVDLKIGGK